VSLQSIWHITKTMITEYTRRAAKNAIYHGARAKIGPPRVSATSTMAPPHPSRRPVTQTVNKDALIRQPDMARTSTKPRLTTRALRLGNKVQRAPCVD
jgi:hypothetical protein